MAEDYRVTLSNIAKRHGLVRDDGGPQRCHIHFVTEGDDWCVHNGTSTYRDAVWWCGSVVAGRTDADAGGEFADPAELWVGMYDDPDYRLMSFYWGLAGLTTTIDAGSFTCNRDCALAYLRAGAAMAVADGVYHTEAAFAKCLAQLPTD